MKSLIDDHPIIWQNYNGIILNDNCTHVFKIPVSVYNKISMEYPAVLEAHEIERAARFKKADDTKRYVIGKFFVRAILAGMLGCSAAAITFSYTEKKKPYLNGPHFNISHSGDLTVIAISPLPVGIDVEFVNEDFNFSSLLSECFTRPELQLINNRIDFYTFWTRKEAILKASGEGLTDNLHAIDCCEPVVYRNGSGFRLLSHRLGNHYIMSLATDVLTSGFRYWNF